MSKNHEQLLELLKGKKPIEVLQEEFVKLVFLEIYQKFHPKAGNPEGVWESEKAHFERAVLENHDLANCSSFTTYGVIVEMAVTGLSINPSWKLAYLHFRNANIGTKEHPIYEKRMFYFITPQGELALRVRLGQIKYADNPVVVFEGDLFKIGLNDRNEKYVRYEAEIPRKSKNIIGCFMRIVRVDGSNDFGIMLQDEIDRLRGYSERNNRVWDKDAKAYRPGKANDLYSNNAGQIDTGFLTTKCIKHSFKTYPRLQLGQFAVLEIELTEDREFDNGSVQESDTSVEDELDANIQVAEELPAGNLPNIGHMASVPQNNDSY